MCLFFVHLSVRLSVFLFTLDIAVRNQSDCIRPYIYLALQTSLIKVEHFFCTIRIDTDSRGSSKETPRLYGRIGRGTCAAPPQVNSLPPFCRCPIRSPSGILCKYMIIHSVLQTADPLVPGRGSHGVRFRWRRSEEEEPQWSARESWSTLGQRQALW